jgi:type IV pilus assembly protein PilW
MKSSKHQVRGLSLVELMVAVVIGMVLILAITQMMVRQDRIRRNVTGINDVAQSSAFATTTLDRDLRSAGSGIAQAWESVFGCVLRVSRANTQILPRASAFPAPFEKVPGSVRGAALLIHGGAGPGGSDVLQLLSGSAGIAEVAFSARANSAKPDSLLLLNTLGVRGGDLALISEEGRGCMVQQVKAGFAGGAVELLEFGGTYAAPDIDTLALSMFTKGNVANVTMLGNTANNPPRFALIGHDANGVLRAYDLLRIDGSDDTQVIGEGVLMLRAIYGVDSNEDGSVDRWLSPLDADYKAEVLTDGTGANQRRLSRVLAVRVGMILRGDLLEREAVSPAKLSLFVGSGLQVDRDLTDEERRLRVRTYEFTVPLRNPMIVAR